MNRIKDYTGFATWFCGLGYIALWPLTSPDLGGKPFGASLLCRDRIKASASVISFCSHHSGVGESPFRKNCNPLSRTAMALLFMPIPKACRGDI